MSKQKGLVGIDIGHHVTRVVMTHAQEGGKFAVVGVGESSTEGLRKGHVFDQDALSKSITVAIEKAEKMAGEPVEQAFVSISGQNIFTKTSFLLRRWTAQFGSSFIYYKVYKRRQFFHIVTNTTIQIDAMILSIFFLKTNNDFFKFLTWRIIARGFEEESFGLLEEMPCIMILIILALL